MILHWDPPLLPTHLRMAFECEHSLLNITKTMTCLLSEELSLLGQTSGEEQTAFTSHPSKKLPVFQGQLSVSSTTEEVGAL